MVYMTCSSMEPMMSKRFKVHPTYKTKYRVVNWPEYDHLVVDATGLGIIGQGQWAAAKWGERGRRGWRKLHVAAD